MVVGVSVTVWLATLHVVRYSCAEGPLPVPKQDGSVVPKDTVSSPVQFGPLK